MKGTDNGVADALSRIDAISQQVEAAELASEQARSPEVASYLGNKLSNLKVIRKKCGRHELICDVSTRRALSLIHI